MKLSARGRRLLEVLQHGSTCSQEMLTMLGPANERLFGNYPPRAASELKAWLNEHPEHGRLEKSGDCPNHRTCERYRLLPVVRAAQPMMQAIPVDPRER